MTSGRAALAAILYTVVVAASATGARAWLSMKPVTDGAVIASVWRSGALVARGASDGDPAIVAALAGSGGELVHETVIAEGPLLARPPWLLAVSLVAGHDGVAGDLDGRSARVTPDDLLARRAYDHGVRLLGVELPLGADDEAVVALLAERLGASAPRVKRDASLRRFRVARTTPRRPETPWAHVDGPGLTAAIVREAARDAARHLASGVHAEGRLRFLVDAISDRELPAYDWPRHAGATYFLAQAADHFHDPEVAQACLRAAALLRDTALSTCDARPGEDGTSRACIGTETRVDVGSSALALLAFAEIARTGLDATYAGPAARLAAFLRAQQRPDGEFMHEFDRESGRPVDVQYPYYSGEAALALARAGRLLGSDADVQAAARGLAHLVGPAWSFFGDRYYFGEEHWTCQAMDELWAVAPDPRALDFCLRWQAFGRRLQLGRDGAVFDAAGAMGLGPFFTPRLTPVASRSEAGVATLEALLRAGGSDREERAALARQQDEAIALLVRRQLRPGPVALMAAPTRVHGGMPGSEVDLTLRVDYAQHAGSAMLRWLDLEAHLEARGSRP